MQHWSQINWLHHWVDEQKNWTYHKKKRLPLKIWDIKLYLYLLCLYFIFFCSFFSSFCLLHILVGILMNRALTNWNLCTRFKQMNCQHDRLSIWTRIGEIGLVFKLLPHDRHNRTIFWIRIKCFIYYKKDNGCVGRVQFSLKV